MRGVVVRAKLQGALVDNGVVVDSPAGGGVVEADDTGVTDADDGDGDEAGIGGAHGGPRKAVGGLDTVREGEQHHAGAVMALEGEIAGGDVGEAEEAHVRSFGSSYGRRYRAG